MAGGLRAWFGGRAAAAPPDLPARREPRLSPRALIEAGQQGRRLRAIPSAPRAINQQIRAYGNTALGRSRYLVMNNPYAARGKSAWVAAMIGTGITPSPQTIDRELKRALKAAWNRWTNEADADGLTDLYGMQAIVAGEMWEAGEMFVRLRTRRPEDGLSVPLQLQLLPAEMLPLDYNVDLGSGRRVECGIQFDAIGRREGYWFWRQHPNTDLRFGANSSERVFVPAAEVLHIFVPRFAGQIRGIPHTIASITTAAMHDLFEDAELERKRNTALYNVFVTRPLGTEDDEDHPFADATAPAATGELVPEPPPPIAGKTAPGSVAMEPGAMVDLLDGESITVADPADVGETFEPFEYRMLTRIMAGFGVPYAEGTGDLKGANYSSMRAGRIVFKREIEMMQHNYFVQQFCQPLWVRWLREAVLAGAVPLSPAAFLSRQSELDIPQWRTPRWESHDPEKDAQADKIALEQRRKSPSMLIEEDGLEPEDVYDAIAADLRAFADRGIPAPLEGTASSQARPEPNMAGAER